MSSVDNRVVQMQFNNREFEAGVSDTLKTLQNLDKTLEELSKNLAHNNVSGSFNSLGDAVNEAGNKFSLLEEIAIGAMRRIGEEVADLGLSLIKELSIENIIGGYDKYESEIEKTAGLINAAKFQGYADPEKMVTESLARIQWFADATSYSYDAMVSAFLAFVNADVPMEKAINLIMGMGAAFSDAGAVATEVGGAFNVLSKSVGEGSMMYKTAINQLQNTYHVLSPQIIQSYIDAAEALDYLTKVEDGYITTNKAYQKGISKQKGGQNVSRSNLNTITGWLNGEVLQKVYNDFAQYAEAVYNVQQELSGTSDVVITLSDSMEVVDKRFEATKNTMTETEIALWELSKEAFLASQEAVTWTVALDAVKDGVSSIWKTIFTNVIGDYKESKELFTNIQDYLLNVFGTPVEALKNTLEEWKAMGGRSALLEGLGNVVKVIEGIIKPIKEAFSEIFPPKTGAQLAEMTEKFRDFTAALIPTEETSEKLKNLFGFIGRGFKLIIDVIGSAIYIFQNFWAAIKPVRDILAETFNIISAGLNKVFDLVGSFGILENMAKQVTYLWTGMKNKLSEFWAGFTDGKTIIATLKDVYGEMEIFTIDAEGMTIFWDNLKKKVEEVIGTIEDTLNPVWDKAKTKAVESWEAIISWIDKAREKIKGFGSDLKKNLVDPIFKAFNTVKSFVENIIGALVGFIGQIITGLTQTVAGTQTIFEKARERMGAVNSTLSGLKAIVTSILAIIARINWIKILESIRVGVEKIKSVPDTIKSLQKPISEIGETLKKFQKQVKAEVLKKIATAVLILAGAMFVVSLIDSEKLLSSLAVIGTAVGIMAGVLSLVSKLEGSTIEVTKKGILSKNGLGSIALALVGFAAGILLIAAAIKTVGSLSDLKVIWSSIGGILLVLGAVIGFTAVAGAAAKKMDKDALKNMNSIGLMVLKMASGILIIAQAMKMIGSMEPKEFKQGALAFAGIMVSIGVIFWAVSKTTDKNKVSAAKIQAFGKAMVELSVAMALMAGSLALISKVSLPGLAQAVGALGLIMVVFSIAANNVQNEKSLTKFGGAMILVGLSMIALAAGLKLVGTLPFNQLAQGFLVFVGAIGAMAIVAEVLGKGNTAVSLLSLAGALLILGPALVGLAIGLAALGMIPLPTIIQGFIFFAAALAALAFAGAIVGKFSGGLISLGIAAIGVGLGVMLAAKGLAVFIGLLEAIKVLSGSGVLEQAFYGIGAAFVGLFMGFLETIIIYIPRIITDLLAAVDLIITSLFNFVESEGGRKLFAIIGKLLEYMPKIISEISGLLLKLIGNLFIELAIGIVRGIGLMTDEEVEAARESAHQFIDGFVKGIKEWIQKGLNAVLDFGRKILGGLKDVLGIKSPSKETNEIAGYAVEGFVNGIKEKASSAVGAMKDLGSNSLDGLKEGLLGGMDTNSLLDTVGLDDTYSITPVLDLSQIEAQSGDLQSMLNDVTSNAIGTGFTDPYNYDVDSLAQLGELNANMSNLNTSAFSADGMASSIKDALNGVGVYADGKKIGQLVTIYQANASRAGGY